MVQNDSKEDSTFFNINAREQKISVDISMANHVINTQFKKNGGFNVLYVSEMFIDFWKSESS